MEGIEYQLRPTRPVENTLRQNAVPLDQKIREADRFRYDEEQLSGTLQMIERVSSTPRGGPHTGNSNCERCTEKRIMITQAYHSFYISHEPDRWDSSLTEYREEMERMFSDPEQYTLEDIHARFQQELRLHIKKDMCTIKRGDSKTVVERKRWSASQFDNVQDLKSTLQTTLEVTLNTTPREAAEAMYALQPTKTAHERAPIYVKYYCTPSWTDTPQQKNIKAKYARQFEAGLSHDQVITAWKNEVLSSQQQEISKLQHRLGELQMAQSAHLKNKAKKAEKDQRIQDREYVFVPKMERCTFTGCNKEVDVNTEGGALQCALCDWLAVRYEDIERKKGWRFFYCSREHVEEDFEDHERNEHICTATYEAHGKCIYAPEPGPDGETGAGGICQDCVMDGGEVRYFCSQECYSHNFDTHWRTSHSHMDPDAVPIEQLELFQPEQDLDIISS